MNSHTTHRKPTTCASLIAVFIRTCLVIALILGALVLISLLEPRPRYAVKETESTMRLLAIALDEYRADVGHYPRGDFAAVASALTDPESGWERADLKGWFVSLDKLQDTWEMDFHYCNHEEYDSSGRGVERTPGKGDFYNPNTYQLYSTGPNMETWPDAKSGGHDRLGGTDEDDIRNWEHDKFCTPDDYRRLRPESSPSR